MATRRERESNCRKPTLRSHCSSHCSSHWCSHCRKPTVVKPYSLPVHMALAINGCPSPSSVLTSFLISLSNVHICGIPSAVFPVRQHQHQHQLSRISISICSAESGSASASAQQDQHQQFSLFSSIGRLFSWAHTSCCLLHKIKGSYSLSVSRVL